MAESIFEEWKDLEAEYQQLEDVHKNYSKKVEEVKAIQKKCMSSIAHQRYRMKQISENIAKLKTTSSVEDKEKFDDLKKKMEECKTHFREMEDILPHENGLYLKIILGSVNVSLLSKQDKYHYKEDYERFKFYLSCTILVLAIVLWFIDYRVIDAVFQFLLVWYYCTLTIRESILIVNGSRIKGWWISHHFISTACAGIFLIWPDGYTYSQFRRQFVVFSVYLSVVQLVQYYYQSGCLYRLRALGERRNMDITVEGFQSWMWKGLSYILPLLVFAYLFQLYNAIVLLQLSWHEKCIEWQVSALFTVFFILFSGNMLTTGTVIRQKLQRSGWMRNIDFVARNKYRFQNKHEHTS